MWWLPIFPFTAVSFHLFRQLKLPKYGEVALRRAMIGFMLNIQMECVLKQLKTAVCMLPSIDSYPNAMLACSMKDKALLQI
ncbi:hypothetical protein ES708_03812 [subsurface metagenome]